MKKILGRAPPKVNQHVTYSPLTAFGMCSKLQDVYYALAKKINLSIGCINVLKKESLTMEDLPNLVHDEELRKTLMGKGVLAGEMLRMRSHFRGLLEERERAAVGEREIAGTSSREAQARRSNDPVRGPPLPPQPCWPTSLSYL